MERLRTEVSELRAAVIGICELLITEATSITQEQEIALALTNIRKRLEQL